MLNGVVLVMTFVLKSFATTRAEVAQRKINSDAAFFILFRRADYVRLIAVFLVAYETIFPHRRSARHRNVRRSGDDDTIHGFCGLALIEQGGG